MLELAERFRLRANNGEAQWGTFLVEFEATGVVHMLANAGLDFILIDGEHGSYGISQMRRLIEAATAAGITALARVPMDQRGTVTQALDCGAAGILFPQIRTMQQVRNAVAMTKYAPLGERGVHLLRPHTGFKTPDDQIEFYRRANNSLITAVQIETPEAVELADDIAATEGVDMLYVGPGDLGALLGVQGADSHPKIIEALRHVGQVCAKHGKIAGCHLGKIENAVNRMEDGFRVFGHMAASRFFIGGIQAFAEQARAITIK
ncbi:MAG: aldolase/citrate lyase family protein [Planctomycetota bacterium]|nr:aldolase/citrate lyase family protein [Planctomycetota bacterium]